jgi:hypothetical protein
MSDESRPPTGSPRQRGPRADLAAVVAIAIAVAVLVAALGTAKGAPRTRSSKPTTHARAATPGGRHCPARYPGHVVIDRP